MSATRIGPAASEARPTGGRPHSASSAARPCGPGRPPPSAPVVRSRLRSRKHSARAPCIGRAERPYAVALSNRSVRERMCMSAARNPSPVRIISARERPSRPSFHTTGTSAGRRRARAASNSCRLIPALPDVLASKTHSHPALDDYPTRRTRFEWLGTGSRASSERRSRLRHASARGQRSAMAGLRTLDFRPEADVPPSIQPRGRRWFASASQADVRRVESGRRLNAGSPKSGLGWQPTRCRA
ncbi:hypothetical protein FOHLNKBM_5592 [Methylobacterium longum]|nr:hypothetical protein FOHLNKBM_5592 [Methylobacterium longum]